MCMGERALLDGDAVERDRLYSRAEVRGAVPSSPVRCSVLSMLLTPVIDAFANKFLVLFSGAGAYDGAAGLMCCLVLLPDAY